MHPLLKDAFKTQIETGNSLKAHFRRISARLDQARSTLATGSKTDNIENTREILETVSEDLEGGIEMLEMLCGEMGRLFEFVPESEDCTAPEDLGDFRE